MVISAALRGPTGRTGGGPAGIPRIGDLYEVEFWLAVRQEYFPVAYLTLRLEVQILYQTHRSLVERQRRLR